jgi:SAM-dependent methyltransferase
MRWVLKALTQQALSRIPRGERLNYVLQRRVLKSLPASEEAFRRKASRAFQHFEAFVEFGPRRPVGEAVFYEFGAGWDLAVQLVYWALGVDRQTVVDIRPILRVELVNDTIAKLERLLSALEDEAGRELRSPGRAGLSGLEDLRERFGIVYLAPRDARDTGLPGGSLDFVSSTDTAEHIPEEDLLDILVECRRLLKPDGLLSYRADLEDHYSRVDGSVSRYNFLRFSDRAWSIFNPALHYQSRLRYPDYVRLTRAAGYEIVREQVSRPSEGDLAALGELDVAKRFRSYAAEDLGVRGLTIVATRSTAAAPRSQPE